MRQTWRSLSGDEEDVLAGRPTAPLVEDRAGESAQTALERVAAILREQDGAIMRRWLERVRAEAYGQRADLTDQDLIDTVPGIVRGVAEALRQRRAEQGEAPWTGLARRHARIRLRQRVPLGWFVREYQVLREEIWAALHGYLESLSGAEVEEIASDVDDALDTVVTIAMGTYGDELGRTLARLQSESSRLGAVLRQMPSGVVIVEAPTGRIVLANEQLRHIWRLPLEPGTDIRRCLDGRGQHPDGRRYAPDDWPIVRALERGESVAGEEIAIERGDGSRASVSASALPIRDGEGRIVAAAALLTDVTARKRAEAEREQLLRDLQEASERLVLAGLEQQRAAEEAGRHAAELDATIAAGRELEEQRNALLRAVSHDLRAPLTAIQGQAQDLLHRLERGGQDGCLRASAEAIVTGAQRMNAMIQDLVDSARLEAGQLPLHLQRVDLRAFILELVGRLAPTYDIGRIRVEAPQGLPPALADPELLERILTNLLANAFKCSAPGAPVEIRVHRQADWIGTSVTDHGQGIPREELPRLFQRPRRVTAAVGVEEGMGLGLYLTRKLVEAQGGRIWAASEVGRGSTFSFSLPVAGTGD